MISIQWPPQHLFQSSVSAPSGRHAAFAGSAGALGCSLDDSPPDSPDDDEDDELSDAAALDELPPPPLELSPLLPPPPLLPPLGLACATCFLLKSCLPMVPFGFQQAVSVTSSETRTRSAP